MNTGPMRVTHVITSLDMGGAEMMLFRLVRGLDQQNIIQHVICLRAAGVISNRLSQTGIQVTCLEMDPVQPSPLKFIQLVKLIRAQKSDILQTWMYHADLLGSLAARFAGNPPVFWGIHNAGLAITSTKQITRMVVRSLAVLSRWFPRRIVVCSEKALNFHATLGFDNRKLVFIPNGFDLGLFDHIPNARKTIREELDIPENAFLIGLVARYHPDKDPANFIRAAALLAEKYPDVYFLISGGGFTPQNNELSRLIPASLKTRLKLIGTRADIPRIMNALDVFTLSSASEAFPLTIGEAMACRIPCVATNVGDTGKIIGETGLVVPREDSSALVEAWDRIMSLTVQERSHLGDLARERIVANYSIEATVQKYYELYLNAGLNRIERS